MVSNTLELKSFKMRDEAVNEATADIMKKIKMLGISISEEQEKEIIEYATKEMKRKK